MITNYNDPKQNEYLDEDRVHLLNKLNDNDVYEGDCLEFMKMLPNRYFDLIITDPPYGINAGEQEAKNNKQHGNAITKCRDWGQIKWDKDKITKEYVDEMIRVSKNVIIFGGNYYANWLNPSSCWIVWDKITGNNGYADCELAWTSFPKAVRQFRFMWKGMFQENMNWKEKRVHPTQKPIALGRWILQKFANKGDKIFDPFAGSGSFLIASKQMGYESVGCEINPEYIKIINERLQQTQLNGTTWETVFPLQESLISVKRESADSPNSPHDSSTIKEEANFS